MHHYDIVSSGIAQKATKGDDRRETSKVQENYRCDRLQSERIGEVRLVVRQLAFDVVNQSTEKSAQANWRN